MPTNSPSDTPRAGVVALLLGGLAFAVLATLNAGGYRYGASDQAFYIPAILHQVDPTLFPRDWAMLGAQGRYFFVDEILGTLVRVTGWSLPAWFAIAQTLTLAALYGGAVHLGRAVLRSPWALAAWIAALTLRHRIAKTGANTLEGYFHPRMLVFGVGLIALGDVLGGRRWRPVLLLLAAGTLHPTTAALFLAIVLVALAWIDPAWRRGVLAAVAVAAVGGVTLLALGRGPDVTPMDGAWRALVATKDYTFPTAWSVGTWLTNLAAPLVLAGVALTRARERRLSRSEGGLLAGVTALLAGFLASLPLIAAGVPIAVQLQTSRAFWPVEALAVLYLVWWITERPGAPTRLARAVAMLLLAISAARGVYVGFLESPDRATLAVDLPDDDWTRALAWIRDQTPHDTFVVADPGHAWKAGMGTAVRIGAWRDVALEETKDVAMAMYSRDAAHAVASRIDGLASFDRLDATALRALTPADGPAVVVTGRTLELPIVHRTGGIVVYQLR
ncbi:MAG: hypothetical protein U0P30_06365 [Vicinamibacterales bacterium]